MGPYTAPLFVLYPQARHDATLAHRLAEAIRLATYSGTNRSFRWPSFGVDWPYTVYPIRAAYGLYGPEEKERAAWIAVAGNLGLIGFLPWYEQARYAWRRFLGRV